MSGGRIAALAALLIAVLCAGIWWGGHPAKLPEPLRDAFVDDAAGLNAEATELIEDNYYRRVDPSELRNGSLQGMVRGLRKRFGDRFSAYLSPQTLKRFEEEISGRFSGIGLSVVEDKRGLRVSQVFRHSPAQRARIRPGDVIVSVGGQSIAGQSSELATSKIRGPEGTAVTIGVLRPSSGKVRSLRLTRAQIELPIVASRLRRVGGKPLGYVRLAGFTEGAHGALQRALRRLERRGAQGILLDLRHNGGGLLDEAVLTASLFLPKGRVVVSTRSRTQGKAVYRSLGGDLPRLPVAVLIDRGTASAAEILTAALAEDAGAPVIGTRSYGKGVFQQEIDLSNGGALKLTIGEYFTPDGENLGGKGIEPDVRARDLPSTARDEALDRALRALARAAREGGQGPPAA